MARKPCKIKVTLPTGKQVYPALGKELSEKFGTNKGDEILQSVLSKEFFQYFGNFIANPKSEFFEGKLDKQGMPLLEHVLDFKQKVLDQKKENLKEKYLGKKTKEVTDLKLKYIQQSIDTLNVQIKEFNRTKGAELYIDNLKEIEKLLESYTEAENKKAFITFLDNAADQAAKILQQLDNIGKISQVEWQNKKVRDQKAKLVQDMYKYIKGYGDLADGILNDYNSKAEEAEGLDIITEDELEVLEELQVAGNRIENKYKIFLNKNMTAIGGTDMWAFAGKTTVDEDMKNMYADADAFSLRKDVYESVLAWKQVMMFGLEFNRAVIIPSDMLQAPFVTSGMYLEEDRLSQKIFL